MFVEDDGRSVRHCTASDDRIAKEAYYTVTLKVETPFGDTSKKLPSRAYATMCCGLRGLARSARISASFAIPG